jgi:hypothetical protein
VTLMQSERALDLASMACFKLPRECAADEKSANTNATVSCLSRVDQRERHFDFARAVRFTLSEQVP